MLKSVPPTSIANNAVEEAETDIEAPETEQPQVPTAELTDQERKRMRDQQRNRCANENLPCVRKQRWTRKVVDPEHFYLTNALPPK